MDVYDIIVVGAGPAGLTAAIYGARANKNVLVLEANSYGGQIVTASCIENYPAMPHVSGFDFAKNLYDQVVELGATIKFEKAIDADYEGDIKKVITDKNEYQCKAVILACGAHNRSLGLDNEKELIGKGVSYCASCDGAFFKNKVVAVNGGGNTALDEALYLSDICKKVYLIHRREEFRGATRTVNKLKKKENVEFILNANVTKIIGEEKLEGIEVTTLDGNVNTLKVSGLFIAIGQVPETNNLTKDLEVDEAGYIVCGENTKTPLSKVYVAGDVRAKKLRQLTTAVSDGSVAMVMALEELNQ